MKIVKIVYTVSIVVALILILSFLINFSFHLMSKRSTWQNISGLLIFLVIAASGILIIKNYITNRK